MGHCCTSPRGQVLLHTDKTRAGADLEVSEVSQSKFEVCSQGLAVSLPLMQGGLGVLQLALSLVQPPPQLLHRIVLAAQLRLHHADMPR